MSKERLEEIQELNRWARIYRDELNEGLSLQMIKSLFDKGHIDWLIEQVESIDNVEKDTFNKQAVYHDGYEQGKFDTNMMVWYEIPELKHKNKILGEAIGRLNSPPEEYANNAESYAEYVHIILDELEEV